ncbi:MAG TPA: hypothetical protein VMU39_23540 [Solirubrobacteraceae bacterium]|nr:hypothetical protein [Solirubrobacteraceae bacterium]
MFIPPAALWGALRLATPGSPWARHRYPPGSRKLARSQARYARAQVRHRRVLDLIGGRPSPERALENEQTG